MQLRQDIKSASNRIPGLPCTLFRVIFFLKLAHGKQENASSTRQNKNPWTQRKHVSFFQPLSKLQ